MPHHHNPNLDKDHVALRDIEAGEELIIDYAQFSTKDWEMKCAGCDFLKNPQPATQILITNHWSVGIGNNHAYLGRALCNTS